jgi:hypothetical protein
LIDDAELSAPPTPCAAARLALPDKFTNRGSAVAAKIPKMTMTITNSIKVKPDWILRNDTELNCLILKSFFKICVQLTQLAVGDG